MLGTLILVACTLWILYKLWCQSYSYWESKGFPFIPGEFPFGSAKDFVTLSRYQGFIMQEFYNKMKKHPFFGIYFVRSPNLVLRDPEMIRLVMTKDFSHFRDRQMFQRSQEEFLSHHLFNLPGERWRTLRVKLSPTFTSGKLKAMFPLFVDCAKELNKLILTKLDKVVDIKDITSSFTSDTICTCAFGIEINSLTNPNSEFKTLGIDIFKTSTKSVIQSAILNLLPKFIFTKFYMPRFTEKYMEDFLLGVVKETTDFREKNMIKRNDFLDLLIELKEKRVIGNDTKSESNENHGPTIEMTYEMMTAQCFVFFAAGFETSSSVMSYCLYELSLHPEIQEKLHQEIVETINSHGSLTYQAVNEMTYLDMVVSETIRKYPTLPILTRICTQKYKFPTGHIVEEGTKVIIPVYAIHHDPSYFPEPDKFNPERFSAEKKNSIKPYTYMPFGEGPRICIGQRFGLLQTKMGLITILQNYFVEKVENTPVPMEFRGTLVVTTVAGPIQLKLSARPQ